MAFAVVFPDELLVNGDADQVRHDLGESMIVVPFHPHDLDAALRVRELADVAEEFPVALGEAAEVEVAEDVAEQDEAAEAERLEELQRFVRAAHLRSEVEIGEDHRIHIHGLHASIGSEVTLGAGQ